MAFTCPASAGSKLTLAFREWADASQPGAIDASHVGPMAIYLKQVSDMEADAAAGPGWFKIWDEGYDAAAKKWATEKLIDNNGLLSINLPSALPTGYYLARHEIITLQNVTGDKASAQPYVGCAQLFIQGGGSTSALPSDKQVTIPGHLDPTDPGLTFNVYTADATTYTIPGPKAFFPTTSAQSQPKTNTKATTTNQQKSGLVPTTCLLKNANWCAAALPDFTDETGCWAAVEDCYDQLDVCYDTAPPTGSKGCRVWDEQMCSVVVAACEGGDFKGGVPELGEGVGEEVDAAVPGGGGLPEAVNAAVEGDVVGGGEEGDGEGEQGGEEAAATPTSAAPPPAATQTVNSRCMQRRRERLRRQMD